MSRPRRQANRRGGPRRPSSRSSRPGDRDRRRAPNAEGSGPEDSVFDQSRAVFMISVAAELAEMHPQTLRMYEARGLITPQRSPKNTRLYSYEDVERLRRIQRMTEEGLNLTGVETVLELETQMERMRSELSRMREHATEIERELLDEVERVRKSFRAELVPYGAYEPEDLVSREGRRRVRIPVERPEGGDGSARRRKPRG